MWSPGTQAEQPGRRRLANHAPHLPSTHSRSWPPPRASWRSSGSRWPSSERTPGARPTTSSCRAWASAGWRCWSRRPSAFAYQVGRAARVTRRTQSTPLRIALSELASAALPLRAAALKAGWSAVHPLGHAAVARARPRVVGRVSVGAIFALPSGAGGVSGDRLGSVRRSGRRAWGDRRSSCGRRGGLSVEAGEDARLGRRCRRDGGCGRGGDGGEQPERRPYRRPSSHCRAWCNRSAWSSRRWAQARPARRQRPAPERRRGSLGRRGLAHRLVGVPGLGAVVVAGVGLRGARQDQRGAQQPGGRGQSMAHVQSPSREEPALAGCSPQRSHSRIDRRARPGTSQGLHVDREGVRRGDHRSAG